MNETKTNQIKIFVSYHKQGEILQSEIIEPIHVGAALSSEILSIQRDDCGQNISDKNDKYCELTGQYWVWKNVKAEYYGFMHYRRHFVFREIPDSCRTDGTAVFPTISDDYLDYVGMRDDVIRECVERYDLILPLVVDVTNWGAWNNEIQFCSLGNLHAADFEKTCQTVLELYPDYRDAVEKFRRGRYAYWFNMFIMRKELFMEYCSWLFHILTIAETKIDYSGMNKQERRTLAFMAERLLSIFIIKLLEERPDLKVKHLKMTFIENTGSLQSGKEKEIPVDHYKETIMSIQKAYSELSGLGSRYTDISEKDGGEEVLPVDLSAYEKIIFYGAGNNCREALHFFDCLDLPYPNEIWDTAANGRTKLFGIPVRTPDFKSVKRQKDVLYIVTIGDERISQEIKGKLRSNEGIDVLEHKDFTRLLSWMIWNRVSAKKIPVVFSTNELYAPYCYLAIHSLIGTADDHYHYDIRVFETELSSDSKAMLENLSNNYVSVTCMNVKDIVSGSDLRGITFLSVETYYRLFIPLALPEYDKVLYLDSDMIIRKDIAELYETDLKGNIAGLVKDIENSSLEKHNRVIGNLNYKYCFNAGVFLLDCRKFEEEGIREKALELLKEDYGRKERIYWYADQDLLQITLHKKVLFLDNRWNYQYQYIWRLDQVYDDYIPEYLEAEKDPWIVHYAGDKKPWIYPELKGARYFWDEAEKSPIYRDIILSSIQQSKSLCKDKLYGYRFPFEQIKGYSRVALYGAGEVGMAFYRYLKDTHYAALTLWVDRNYEEINEKNQKLHSVNENIEFMISDPSELVDKSDRYDYVVVAIDNTDRARKIVQIIKDMGIDEKKIIWEDYHFSYMRVKKMCDRMKE